MNRPNILVVDDVEFNRMVLENILIDKYNVFHAGNGKEAMELFENSKTIFHLILLDINMPIMNGYEVLKYMKEKDYLANTPVMVISTDANEENVLAAYDLGAVDYFNKPFNANIVLHRVENILKVYGREYFDVLTSGPNRKGFIRDASNFLENVNNPEHYAFLYFDVQDFKALNDLFGPNDGDQLLLRIYTTVQSMFNANAMVSRMEADHYIALVEKDDIHLDVICKKMDLNWSVGNKSIHAYLKCGIAYIDDFEISVETYINRARLARQQIIDEYVQPYAIFDTTKHEEYVGKAEVITSFMQGLENEEFKVYYQPVVDPVSGKVASAEALVRWVHPEKGIISPGLFIPVLESGGYISKLDDYIIQHVADTVKRRKEENLPCVPVSVNLSWMDFYDKNIEHTINHVCSDELKQTGVRFEVTETSMAALENANAGISLDFIHQMGSKIYLDDFGTGYSSFSMIDKFAFDVLKIDMSFVRKIGKNPKMEAVIQLIIEMCHKINVKVIAEGAETKEQVDFLVYNDCDYIQGYYFSKPLPEDKFFEYLEEHRIEEIAF